MIGFWLQFAVAHPMEAKVRLPQKNSRTVICEGE